MGIDAPDLAALMQFTPAALPLGDGGALAAHGRVSLPAAEGERPSGQFVVTVARLDTAEREGVLRSEHDVTVSIENGRVAVGDLHAVGDGVDLRLRGSADLSGEKAAIDAKVTARPNASVLGLVAPDLGLTGRLVVDLSAAGALSAPAINGTIRIEDGRYRMAGYSFEEIEGTLRLLGSSGELEGLAPRSPTARPTSRAASAWRARRSRTSGSRRRGGGSACARSRRCA